jgi:galactose-1-phosphate uridylyltransferase
MHRLGRGWCADAVPHCITRTRLDDDCSEAADCIWLVIANLYVQDHLRLVTENENWELFICKFNFLK